MTRLERKMYGVTATDCEKYDVRWEIHHGNRKILWLSSLMMMFLFGIMLVLSLTMKEYQQNRVLYAVVTVTILMIFIFCHKFFVKQVLGIKICMYAFIFLLYYYSIYVGILMQQKNYAVTVCLFLAVLPLLFMDRPLVILAVSTGAMAVMVVLMFLLKESSILVIDLTDVIFSWVMGSGLGIFINRIKFQSYIQQKQVVVERDTDNLTGLYNKGALERKITELMGKKNRARLLLWIWTDLRN